MYHAGVDRSTANSLQNSATLLHKEEYKWFNSPPFLYHYHYHYPSRVCVLYAVSDNPNDAAIDHRLHSELARAHGAVLTLRTIAIGSPLACLSCAYEALHCVNP
jgi:hypothetical protein